MVSERLPWTGTIRADHAPDASYGIYPEWARAGRAGCERYRDDTGPEPTGLWHTDSYATGLDEEAQTQSWSERSYANFDASLNSLVSPDFTDSPAEESLDRWRYLPAPEPGPEPEHALAKGVSVPPVAHPAPHRAGHRNRRASARRSALLTIAAPSVAFIGVAGMTAVSVTLDDQGEKNAEATPEVTPPANASAANGKLDSQLAGLSADADDFADRASRTQERIDLRQRQMKEQERKDAEAARKEARRPKFALPVRQRGVGELFGAVGSMWSKRHTGLDFPVPLNTPVMAVTDGTVEAKWDPFYGNMVIVTAPDGTETWYCHLASARIRSGHVKAGSVIAYAGSSGNSSGPHLHLEVHPGGGDAVDPLPWLRSHGLDPT